MGLPRVRRRTRAAPRERDSRLSPLWPSRAGPATLSVWLDVGPPPRRRHRAHPARAFRDARRRRLPSIPARCGHDRRGERSGCRCGWGGGWGGGGVGDLLSRFEAAPAGVLIGTQMVAKGHDFADVTLGVVLDADATLRFPDFRAEERTFALIAQLAGRVGRGTDGQVLVQTIAPDARSIVHAARHDSDGFLAGELERRCALEYPPFSSLIRVVCSAEHSARAHTAATVLRERLAGCGGSILGPAGLFRLP